MSVGARCPPVLLLLSASRSAIAQFYASFEHGVASGDPHSDSIVLWTRVTPHSAAPPAQLNVSWRVWRDDADASEPVQDGVYHTDAGRDWTVKLLTGGLAHSTRYLYDFSIGAARSASGRFQLPPPAGEPLERLHYAVFSCSSWSWGYFNAYRAAATGSEPLDFWLHVGDYIYEYGQEGHYPPPDEAVRWHGLQPRTETLTLEDYRQRHALHRTDADLQLLSAAAPLIAVWDDHEIANDPWVGGAQDHNDGEGDWWARKRAAVRAYHEWLPTRLAPPPSCDAHHACDGAHDGEVVYRSFRFGDLAALHVLETRLLARAQQAVADGRGEVEALVGALPPRAWEADAAVAAALGALNATWHAKRDGGGRELLGEAQLAWLRGAMLGAAGAGAAWQLIGQQVIVQPRQPPDLLAAADAAAAAGDAATAAAWRSLLETLTTAPGDGGAAPTVAWHDGAAAAAPLYGTQQPIDDGARAAVRAMLAMAHFGLNPDFDGWDGYPAARRRLLEVLLEGGAQVEGRVAVYAGDSHAAWAGQLASDAGEHVALEFDGTAVTSSGPDSWLPYLPPALLAGAWRAATPRLGYASTHTRGWMDVRLTPAEHAVAFMTVSHVASRANVTAACDAAFVQAAAAPHELRRVRCEDALPAADVARALDAPRAAALAPGGGDAAPFALAVLVGAVVGVVASGLALGAVRLHRARTVPQMAARMS